MRSALWWVTTPRPNASPWCDLRKPPRHRASCLIRRTPKGWRRPPTPQLPRVNSIRPKSQKTWLRFRRGMRLNQYLAHAGLGSRRSVEALITAGRVTINGMAATLHSQVAPEESEVRLDGKPIRLPVQSTYLMLHKPPGYT